MKIMIKSLVLIERYIDLNSQSKANETKAIELVEQEIEKSGIIKIQYLCHR